jgi:membrane associated rhomboid family serine protease
MDDIQADRDRLATAFLLSGLFASLLWLILIFESVTGIDLGGFGVRPGEPGGLVGLLTAPFLHGGEKHLFANTLPLVILGTALLYGYPRAARILVPALFVVAGLGVWLFGRSGSHIGASGLNVGMMFFVFTIGVLRWDRRAIGLALIAFFLYGGMVWSVLPGDPQVSFEFHLAGAIVGTVLAVLLRNLDPRPPEKRYSWELESEDGEVDGTPWAERAEGGIAHPGALPLPAAQPSSPRADQHGASVPMNLITLRDSLGAPAPPQGLSPPVRALWHLARDEWDAAHAIVQEEDDADSAWVHAHLHRVEGDLSNARYWYGRAGRLESHATLEDEWQAIATELLAH